MRFILSIGSIIVSFTDALEPICVNQSTSFHEMRVTFEIMDEKSLSAKELSFIEDDVIPHIKEFTRKGLRTKSAPVDYRYMLSSSKAWCGPNSTELDLADFNSRMTRGESDLHLWIRPIWEKNKYMSVSNCLRDYCGKVVGGLMNINMNMFATPSSKKAHMSAIMHEMIHVFAFASFLFQDFETIRPDMPNPKPIYYKCSKNQMTGKFSVEWNLPEWSPGVMMYTMTPSVVKPINVRGINASDCRCPFDPNRTYTNEDIEFCLENPHHCPVGIWTPKVVEAVRAYSGCPTLDAMELETGMPLSCASFIDPHWKMDHIGNEMMSAIDLGGPSYLSPMTLALVEDSGWYKVNYDALVSKPLERASPGYRAGCPYWRDSKCTNRLGDSSELVFCNSDKTSCSGDGLTLINCNTREKSFLLKGDECTRFTYSAAGNTENQRCFDRKSDVGMFSVKCLSDKSGYAIVDRFGDFMSPICRKEGETVKSKFDYTICSKPELICKEWAHVVMDTKWNNLPILTDTEVEKILELQKFHWPSQSIRKPSTVSSLDERASISSPSIRTRSSAINTTGLVLIIFVLLGV